VAVGADSLASPARSSVGAGWDAKPGPARTPVPGAGSFPASTAWPASSGSPVAADKPVSSSGWPGSAGSSGDDDPWANLPETGRFESKPAAYAPPARPVERPRPPEEPRPAVKAPRFTENLPPVEWFGRGDPAQETVAVPPLTPVADSAPVTDIALTAEEVSEPPEDTEPAALATEPKTDQPKTAELETPEPEAAAPEALVPEALVPGTVASETLAPETSAPETSDAPAPEETAGTDAVAPESAEPRTEEPRTVEPRTVEPRTDEAVSAQGDTPEPADDAGSFSSEDVSSLTPTVSETEAVSGDEPAIVAETLEEPAASVAEPVASVAEAETENDAPADDAAPEAAAVGDPLREVTVVPGVPRYHNAQCILIRFMGEGDLEKMTLADARKAGCTPCRACLPDQETD
jgi:nicotinate-nucleotide--dimethylbenzimidazole phosphoribosyltransferase